VGVASPIMFCLYIDELLLKLADSVVGCWFGKFYVGVLAYTDDQVLLAPRASSMCIMLSYCNHFASQCSLVLTYIQKTIQLMCTSALDRRHLLT